jgi:hypothetical protein
MQLGNPAHSLSCLQNVKAHTVAKAAGGWVEAGEGPITAIGDSFAGNVLCSSLCQESGGLQGLRKQKWKEGFPQFDQRSPIQEMLRRLAMV